MDASVTSVEMTIFDQNGETADSAIVTLPAYAQTHFAFNDFTLGSVLIEPDSQVLVGSAVYYYGNSHGISAAEYNPGSEALGSELSGSFNVYLGMQNWLRLFNTSSDTLSVTLSTLDDANNTITQAYSLAPHGRQDVALNDIVGQDRYGLLTLTTDSAGHLAAGVLRVENSADLSTFNMVCPTPVR